MGSNDFNESYGWLTQWKERKEKKCTAVSDTFIFGTQKEWGNGDEDMFGTLYGIIPTLCMVRIQNKTKKRQNDATTLPTDQTHFTAQPQQ